MAVVLPFADPCHQAIPSDTQVLDAKAGDPSFRLVLDLEGQIRLAHERLSNQIDAMTDMRRRCHEREIPLVLLLTCQCSIERRPVPHAYRVLVKHPALALTAAVADFLTRQWS